jgi:hypothetical protein
MRGPSFEETKGPGVTATGETRRQPLETTLFKEQRQHFARFAAVTRRLVQIAQNSCARWH